MFHQQVANLLEQPFQNVRQWFNSFDTVICDGDGVLWNEQSVITGSIAVIEYLQHQKKKIYFCTNNTSLETYEITKRIKKNGYNVQEDQILSTAHSTAMLLKNKNFQQDAYVIGKLGIVQELQKLDIPCIDVGPDILEHSLPTYLKQNFWLPRDDIGVVIVGLDEHFSYAKLLKAKTYLSNPNCLLVGMNNEQGYQQHNGIVPGSAAIIKAVEKASKRTALIVGKPHRAYLEHLFADGTIEATKTLIIGDSCKSDILLGFNCACQTLLVGSGLDSYETALGYKNSRNEELNKLTPDVYLPTLGDLLQCLDVDKSVSYTAVETAVPNSLSIMED